MKNESDPITDDEWLLRRVYKDRFRTDKAPIISPRAFEPRSKGDSPDVDGISLYRAACLSSPDEILANVDVAKLPDQGIVRLSVAAVRELNLSIQSKPIGEIPGHVVIPEINSGDYTAAKSDFTSMLLELAKLASEIEATVRWPPSQAR